jgi:16S rRNA (guanine(966)-N(2))-methyltransferase RsmD
VRVIAGKYRGRRLRAPRGLEVRPTSDRVREALFSILSADVEGRAVLDLFSGTGALAIEALSRGAASAVLVDSSAEAIKTIKSNLMTLEIDNAEVQRMSAQVFLQRAAQRDESFSLVFIDPPYRLVGALSSELSVLLPPVLVEGAAVVCESDRRSPLELDLPLTDERRYGDTVIRIYTTAE